MKSTLFALFSLTIFSTSLNAQVTLKPVSARFDFSLNMEYHVYDSRYATDSIYHNLDSMIRHSRGFPDTLLEVLRPTVKLDSFSYYWPGQSNIPVTWTLSFRLDRYNKKLVNVSYAATYSSQQQLSPNPYPGTGTNYEKYKISLSSLDYNIIEDTLLVVDMEGNDYFQRILDIPYNQGYEESWGGKYPYILGNEWRSIGIGNDTTDLHCHLIFIVPKNFVTVYENSLYDTDVSFTSSITYPTGNVLLRFSPLKAHEQLIVFDMLGRIVFSSWIPSEVNEYTLRQKLLKPGAYTAKLGQHTSRIIIPQ